MNKHAAKWTMYAWIAALAILFNTLVPAFACAGSLAANTEVVEMCTVSGTKHVSLVDQSPTEPADSLHKAIGHCAYCAAHCSAVALLPPTGVTIALAAQHSPAPILSITAPHHAAHWTAGPIRAPPLRA